MKKHSRTKSRQLASPSSNFIQKYTQLTKDRKFITPIKKPVILKNQLKQQSPTKQILNVMNRAMSPKNKVQQLNKININMQIKNLNIFSSQSLSNLNQVRKKKLHKKTISALQQPKQIKKKIIQSQAAKPMLKHKKTKSQQNIKLSPQQWGQLLTKYSKPKKVQQQQSIISKFAYCNRTGFACEKKQKINQDTFIIVENFIKSQQFLFGVCDGHGLNGHYVAKFIREILPENIEYYFIKNKLLSNKQTGSSIQSSIRDAFLKTQKDLLREMNSANIDIKFSGTTTCMTYIHQNKLYCVNLGDSRAVIFSRQGQRWSSEPLSCDHKGENPVEAQRIIINGGRVAPYYDQDGEQMGPYRVWMKHQNFPGLAMTRSFGDVIASRVGVISQPQITQFQIKKQNKFMVVASDGLWEFISNEQVMKLVVPAFIRNDVNQAVQVLQNKAVQAWMREDQNIDDITIIVTFFKYY